VEAVPPSLPERAARSGGMYTAGMVESIEPQAAHDMLTSTEGAVYLDVRTPDEFAQGHPAGAYNIPVMEAGAFGMKPNPEFLAVALRVLSKDALVVVGCKAGPRSLMAAEALSQVGFTQLVNVAGGFHGSPSVRGWSSCGLPSAKQPEPGRTWDELRKRG
jgi:rhodanese-related sulfurtransferase